MVRNREIEIGKLGRMSFEKGFYLYVGSAQNGIEQRAKRHLRKRKKKFWHIDYLLSNSSAQVKEVWIKEGKKRECELARKLKKRGFKVIKGFGSSDCRCNGHLFYIERNITDKILKSLGLRRMIYSLLDGS